MSWDELGPGCFRRRYASFDLNVGVVVGASGTLLIDTRASGAEADELRADLRSLGADAPRWVVNTHAHFEHCLGNARFRGSELWGHTSVPGALAGFNRELTAARYPEWGRATAGEPLEIVPPDRLVVAPEVLDLGDRLVEVAYLGPGHTEGDVVVVVPDAGVVFAGDLVGEGPPSFGSDCYPMNWPDTADGLLVRVPAGGRVVPGHGDVLDRAAVQRQASELRQVATEIRALYDAGTELADALELGTWPYPSEVLMYAARRGFWQLEHPSGLLRRIG